MTTPDEFRDRDDDEMGEVLDFPALAGQPADPAPGAGRDARPAPADDDDPDDQDGDAESVEEDRVIVGVPVDPPGEYRPRRRAADRAPVIPSALASREALADSLRWAWREARYHAGLPRGPRAEVRRQDGGVRAVPGALRTAGRLVRWASAEDGNWHLRQSAADRGDADTWLTLDARRQRQAKWRWPSWSSARSCWPGAVLVSWPPGRSRPCARLAGLAAAAGLAARLGRPADKPITDRVRQGKTYRKLTAELVRRALLSVQLAGINSAVAKDPERHHVPGRDPPRRPRSPGRRRPALRGRGRRRDRPPRAPRVRAAAAAGPGLARARARSHRPPGAVGRPRARLADAPARVAAARPRDGGRVQAVRVRHHPPAGHRRARS